ncbi:MAG: hypothetical protein IJI07_00885 [Flexilinea sp.]|nr:hypothetical protein [Flexilinea sp.]
MKKTFVILLALFLTLCLSGPVFCEDGSPDLKFEGEGFDTPEDAVLAFIDAWNREDVRAALSTFAIESLVDHMDTGYYLEYLRQFNPTQNYFSVPANNIWIRDLEVVKRYAEVSNFLYNQYLTNNSGENARPTGQPIQVKTREEIDNLLSFFEPPLTESWIGHIRFLEWIDPLLIDRLTSYGALRNMTMQADLYGADDIMSLIAHIDLGDHQAILTMECLNYGGRWFNFRTYGQAAMILSLEPLSSGLYVFPQEEAVQLISMYLTEPDPEAKAVLNSHLKSSLPGTRWKLVKAAGGNEKNIVVDQIEMLDNWDREGTGIWAELHFTTLGATIHTYAAESGTEGGMLFDRLYDMWVEDGNMIRFEGDLSGTGIMSGNQLVITAEGGRILQLKKIDDCNVCTLH